MRSDFAPAGPAHHYGYPAFIRGVVLGSHLRFHLGNNKAFQNYCPGRCKLYLLGQMPGTPNALGQLTVKGGRYRVSFLTVPAAFARLRASSSCYTEGAIGRACFLSFLRNFMHIGGKIHYILGDIQITSYL